MRDVDLEVFVKECSVSDVDLGVAVRITYTIDHIVGGTETVCDDCASGAMQIFVGCPVKGDAVAFIEQQIVGAVPVQVGGGGVLVPCEVRGLILKDAARVVVDVVQGGRGRKSDSFRCRLDVTDTGTPHGV